MIWVGLDENNVIQAYGKGKKRNWFPVEHEFDSYKQACDRFSSLEETIVKNKKTIDLSKTDVSHDVSYAHSAKVMEAMGAKFMGLEEEHCPMCHLYAQSQGISFEDAINRVWSEYQIAARREQARTTEKDKIRKGDANEVVKRSGMGDL